MLKQSELISLHERYRQIRVDRFGIDPLRDTSFSALRTIVANQSFLVTQKERARPDLISFKFYETTDLWWVILIYNNIFSAFEIYEGVELEIPNLSTINDILNMTRNDVRNEQTNYAII